MSRHQYGDSIPPIEIDKHRAVKTPLGLIVVALGAAAIAGGAYFGMRGKLDDHTEQIKAISAQQRDDHDLLISIKADIAVLRREVDQRSGTHALAP